MITEEDVITKCDSMKSRLWPVLLLGLEGRLLEQRLVLFIVASCDHNNNCSTTIHWTPTSIFLVKLCTSGCPEPKTEFGRLPLEANFHFGLTSRAAS